MPTRPERIQRRADRVMGRATKNYGKYEALRKSIGDREMTDNEANYADKLERRVARQETRAKNLKNKAQYITDKKMANKRPVKTLTRTTKVMSRKKPVNTLTRTTKTMTRKK